MVNPGIVASQLALTVAMANQNHHSHVSPVTAIAYIAQIAVGLSAAIWFCIHIVIPWAVEAIGTKVARARVKWAAYQKQRLVEAGVAHWERKHGQ